MQIQKTKEKIAIHSEFTDVAVVEKETKEQNE